MSAEDDPVDLGQRRLLRTLTGHGVEFVLVGGVALRLHGYSGATKDIDVTIATTSENGERVTAALDALNARVDLPGQTGTRYRTDAGLVDVMRLTSGPADFAVWRRAAIFVLIEPGLTVLVGSASDLLLSKEIADRPKDRETLPRIRAELLAIGALAPQDVRGPVAEIAPPEALEPAALKLLGPRPSREPQRRLWDHHATAIAAYRERWAIPRSAEGLGATLAPASTQAAERDALWHQLERHRRLVEAARDHLPAPGDAPGHEL